MTSPIVGGSPPPIRFVIANMAIEGTKTRSAPATIPGWVRGIITCEKARRGLRSEIISRFDYRAVQPLDARVDRQNHEGQEIVNQSQHRGEGSVENSDRLRNNSCRDQEGIEDPFFA